MEFINNKQLCAAWKTRWITLRGNKKTNFTEPFSFKGESLKEIGVWGRKGTRKWWKVEESGARGMLMGEFHHTVDGKGRLILPSRFRELLGDGCVITRGLEKCLFVYTNEQWATVQERLQSLAFTNKTNRAFIRFFLSGAIECQLDRQGRVLLPQNLRDYAQLDRDAAIIGVLDRLEIWDRSTWETYRDNTDDDFENLAEELDGFWE